MPLTGGALWGAGVFAWALGGDVRASWVNTAGAALGLSAVHAARGGATGFVAQTLRRARACSAPVR